MEYVYATETGTATPHMQHKHGVKPATVEAAFPLVMRDWQDGNHRVRICKAGKRGTIRIAYDWIVTNKKVKIYSAYFWP